MAAPGFGFSFGDFVTAIRIVKDINRALRDRGGAKDEFQNVLVDLRHLEILLEQLSYGAWDHGGDAGHLNAIKGMAMTCQIPLRDFLDKINKYKAIQGTSIGGVGARLGGQARKMRWAVGMKEEVEKFRAIIAAKMVSINLLIQLHTLSMISKISSGEGSLAEKLGLVRAQIEGCRQDIQQLRGEFGKANMEQSDVDVKRSVSTLVQICTCGKPSAEQFRDFTRAQHIDIKERFVKLEKLHSRGHSIMISNSVAINRLETNFQQLMAFFGGFSGDILKLLRIVQGTDLEIYALLREMRSTILQAPVLGNQDSIKFTDALGRKKLLPYQYFRHWGIFQAMLICNFRQLPGERLVAQGRYILLDKRRKYHTTDTSRWEISISPSADISMSIVIPDMLFDQGLCPRVACGARNAQYSSDSNFIICPKCNLEYRSLDVPVQLDSRADDIGRENRPLPIRGKDMSRGEGLRFRADIKLEKLDFPLTQNFQTSVEEELEVFKSIHIQTQSKRKQPDKKPSMNDNKNTKSATMVTKERINFPIQEDSITHPPTLPGQPLRKPPTPESRIGMFVGQSLELIGISRFGIYTISYSAFDHSDRTFYTVKVLSNVNHNGTPLDGRNEDLQRREMKLHCAASSHPNIVSMLKVIARDMYGLYVLLEYCSDEDLSSAITKGLYLSNDTLIRTTFLEVLSAVQHCHKLGIYHRFLTPENMLLRGRQVLLTEFSLAITQAEEITSRCGMLPYMSPGTSGALRTCQTAPNDVWALGVVLVNLVCGRGLWREASVRDDIYRAYLSDRNFLKSFLPISNEVNRILVKIFEPDVEKRITLGGLIIAVNNCPAFAVPLNDV